MKKIGTEFRVPVLGHNCLGIINTNPAISMNASFSRSMPRREIPLAVSGMLELVLEIFSVGLLIVSLKRPCESGKTGTLALLVSKLRK